MKRTPAIAGVLLAGATIATITAGCSNDDTSTAAATAAPTTTTAPATYTWDTFRTKYDDFLTADCKAMQGDKFAGCANWQAHQIGAMLVDIKQLPANSARTKAEQAMNSYLSTHTSVTDTGCLAVGGMDSIGSCSVSKLGLDAGAEGLQTFIRLGAA